MRANHQGLFSYNDTSKAIDKLIWTALYVLHWDKAESQPLQNNHY